MNENYVSFEQAKALKELGFDWKCYTFYHWDNWCGLSHSGICENHNMFEKCISAPTLAQAQKWFLEEKKIYIEIYCTNYLINFGYELKFDYDSIERYCCQGYNNPKDALSAGIDTVIECIRNEHF